MARAGWHPLPPKRRPEPKRHWWVIRYASGRVLVGYSTKKAAQDSAPRFFNEGAWTIEKEVLN